MCRRTVCLRKHTDHTQGEGLPQESGPCMPPYAGHGRPSMTGGVGSTRRRSPLRRRRGSEGAQCGTTRGTHWVRPTAERVTPVTGWTTRCASAWLGTVSKGTEHSRSRSGSAGVLNAGRRKPCTSVARVPPSSPRSPKGGRRRSRSRTRRSRPDPIVGQADLVEELVVRLNVERSRHVAPWFAFAR
jgi:hypothetical protein